jgi:hypothetical protein
MYGHLRSDGRLSASMVFLCIFLFLLQYAQHHRIMALRLKRLHRAVVIEFIAWNGYIEPETVVPAAPQARPQLPVAA